MAYRTQTLSISLLAAAALTACGGGGDAASPVAALVDITASNYEQVASTFAGASALSIGLTQDPQLTFGNVTDVVSLSTVLSATMLGTLQRAMATEQAQAVNTIAVACVSGSSSVAVDDANNNGRTDAGDSVTLTDNACVRDGVTSSGSVRIVLNTTPTGTLAIGSNAYDVDATMTLSNYREDDGSSVTVTSGSLRFQSMRTAFRTGHDVVTVPQMSNTDTDAGGTVSTVLTGVTASVVYTPTVMTAAMSGDFTDSALGDRRVTLSTPVAFQQGHADAYPSVGQAKVVGAHGRSVTVTALNSVQARVSADLNGDGVDDTDRTVIRNWSQWY